MGRERFEGLGLISINKERRWKRNFASLKGPYAESQ